ncbi:SMI1/KNR4 family protein [Lysinibacillus sp. Y5S-8]
MNGLSFTNGVLIYGTVELLERNETWEVAEYAKGYIAIGDDGGGMVFLMNRQGEDGHVFAVDCGDMNPQHATLITSDLNKWLQDGCQLETI